jgi:hypothetical protein
VILTVRLTDAEHAHIGAAAKDHNTSLSALGRTLLMGQIPPPMIDREFAQELGRVGNNLNQIARNLNAGEYPPSDGIQVELRNIRELLLRVQEELRRDRKTHER